MDQAAALASVHHICSRGTPLQVTYSVDGASGLQMAHGWLFFIRSFCKNVPTKNYPTFVHAAGGLLQARAGLVQVPFADVLKASDRKYLQSAMDHGWVAVCHPQSGSQQAAKPSHVAVPVTTTVWTRTTSLHIVPKWSQLNPAVVRGQCYCQ